MRKEHSVDYCHCQDDLQYQALLGCIKLIIAKMFGEGRYQGVWVWGVASGEASDNEISVMPTAFKGVVQPEKLTAAIATLELHLRPDVVRIRHMIGEDSSGQPAIYFRVLLSDRASRPDRLRQVTRKVRNLVYQNIDPVNSWGLVPYLRFRSQSEQAELQEPAWA